MKEKILEWIRENKDFWYDDDYGYEFEYVEVNDLIKFIEELEK